jgi:phosphoglycolate phosphatase
MPLPYQAVIFDLDGTLIDSAPDLCAALNLVLAENGRREVGIAEVTLMVGGGLPNLVDLAFRATGEPLAPARLAELAMRYRAVYEDASTVLTRPYPGAVAALEALRDAGAAMGLCTNKPHSATLKVIETLELAQYFRAVLGGDRARFRKPDGRHVLEVMEAMGAARGEAVYVGDSETDLAAARGAGVPAVLVDFGYSKRPAAELGADAVISDFADLNAALSVLKNGRGG